MIAPRTRETFGTELLARLSNTLGLGVAVASEAGEIVWTNESLEREFPACFQLGRRIDEAIERSTAPVEFGFSFDGSLAGGSLRGGSLRGGSLRCARDDEGRVFRYFRLDVQDRPGSAAHCLVDITPEKKLVETYRSNLRQLASMKEIIDLLYESTSTGELINLILVAVTAGQGFGFNRALFLAVSGSRLRGRMGIGPDSAEEAYRIWTQLDEVNSSLRETLERLTQSGDPPDPATQGLASSIDIDLSESAGRGSAVVAACLEGRPVLVTAASSGGLVDNELFRKLEVDAIAVVPLRVRERLAGVILADNFVTRKAISPDDLKLLKAFSGYAGLALERTSLYDDLTSHVTKLRRANRELQDNQKRLLKAERLSALGSIAASVSHEIRNPLVAIGGLARSVLDDENVRDDARESLEIIVSEVRRLERFLTDTLEMAKPSIENLETVDFVQLVREVGQTYREELARAGIELELVLPDHEFVAPVAASTIRGALSNLIKNSNEAIEDRGTIRIELSIVHGQGKRWIADLVVSDTGSGIPEDAHKLIFEPFFTTKRYGTGIGLAITSQNIRHLGGTLSIERHPPFNTAIRIRLPIARESGESV